MVEADTPSESDAASVGSQTSGEPTCETIRLLIDGHSMTSYEMRRAIERAMSSNGKDKSDEAITIDDGGEKSNNETSGGNSLSLERVGLNVSLTEDLVKLVRQTKHWDSISLSLLGGDRTRSLCEDLLWACTAHVSVRSIAWRSQDSDVAEDVRPEPTSTSTIHALLYGLKYNSLLTTLDTSGLVIDANIANLLSRVLVRNTTLVELKLNRTRFLGDAGNNNNTNNANHRGTKNTTVQTLSFGLRFNRTIESLYLEACSDLEDEDVACLINAVNSDGTVLKNLSLQETACYDQAMASIAVMLHGNVIEHLNLSYLKRRRKKPKEEEIAQQPETPPQEEEQQQEDEEESEQDKAEGGEQEEEAGDAKAAPTTETAAVDDGKHTPEESPPQKDQTLEKNNEEESQKVRNTSLKFLSMAGNFLDDDYLESLLNVFPPPSTTNLRSSGAASKDDDEEPSCSRLEELDLLGNRFSNHGIKTLLKKLPRFPYLQRLYLGYQRAPPPSPLPPHMLSRMVASDPSLLDRHTAFSPGSLQREFVAAVSEHPSNYRLKGISFMALTKEDRDLGDVLEHHMRLNHGGRKLLTSCVRGGSGGLPPLGLWPLVLDRANRLYPLPLPGGEKATAGESTPLVGEASSGDQEFHAGDVIFCLLHGPMGWNHRFGADRTPM